MEESTSTEIHIDENSKASILRNGSSVASLSVSSSGNKYLIEVEEFTMQEIEQEVLLNLLNNVQLGSSIMCLELKGFCDLHLAFMEFILRDFLPAHPSIDRVALNHKGPNIAAIATLLGHTRIKHIKLSGAAKPGLANMREGLATNNTLESLIFESPRIDQHELNMIKSIVDSKPGTHKLKNLHLTCRKFLDDAIASIANWMRGDWAYLKVLSLRGCISHDAYSAIVCALPSSSLHGLRLINGRNTNILHDVMGTMVTGDNFRMLKALDIRGNAIGNAGAIHASRFICNEGKSLEMLNLSRNKIGDDGMLAVAHALKSNTPSLKHLHLRKNNLTSCGCWRLATAFNTITSPSHGVRNCTLHSLSLDGHQAFTSVGVKAFTNALVQTGNHTMELLSLDGCNNVGREEIDAIYKICLTNKRLNTMFQRLKDEFGNVSNCLGLWPYLLGSFSPRPSLLFAAIKSNKHVLFYGTAISQCQRKRQRQ